MVIGWEPLQLPGSAWSCWPFRAVPEIVGSEVFDGGVALELAPAPAARPSRTTSASVPATPSEAPRRAERFFAESDMVLISFLGVPSPITTPPAAKPGAMLRGFHEAFATSLRAAYRPSRLRTLSSRGGLRCADSGRWRWQSCWEWS